MLKLIIGAICIVGLIAYGVAVASLYDSALFSLARFKAAFTGLIVGAGIWVVFGRRLNFFGIFEHELTHLVFSILMFQRPRSFYASEHRGHVSCDRGNFIDGLAPYFFPTYSFFLLAIYPVLKPGAYAYFYPLLGLVTGYHIISNIGEFRPGESDIRRYGTMFSLVFCAFAGVVAAGFIFAFVIDGFPGALRFLADGWREAAKLLLRLWTLASNLL